MCAFSQETGASAGRSQFRAGIQTGANMESTDGYAYSVGAHADTLVLPSINLLVGMQMDFTVASSSWSSNPSMYVEWLMPLTIASIATPFIKANLGMFVYHDDDDNDQSGVLASLGVGLNFDIGEHIYIAPAITFGYPFLWAPTLSAGWRF